MGTATIAQRMEMIQWCIFLYYSCIDFSRCGMNSFSPAISQENACVCPCVQLCLTLCDPLDCSSPGSSVQGISQAKIVTGVGCHFLLQGIFLHQGLNPHLLHWQANSLLLSHLRSLQFSSVAQLCLTLSDPMDCSTPDFPVHHQLPELAQTYVH